MSLDPIIFTITNAGKNACLNAVDTGLELKLTSLAYGGGKYVPDESLTALANQLGTTNIITGDIETESHTLRFSADVRTETITNIYEVGLITEDGTLFAVASSTDEPILRAYPDIAFIGSFGLKLDDLDTSNLTVVNDPNGALAIRLMENHLAHPDPHPQYAMLKLVEALTETVKSIKEELMATQFEILNEKFNTLKAMVESNIRYPIGAIFETTIDYNSGSEVAQAVGGYGTWERYAEGRVTVGKSNNPHADAPWTGNIGEKFGDYEHTLTVDEMPSHTHEWDDYNDKRIDEVYEQGKSYYLETGKGSLQGIATPKNAGGDKPHNNVPPSVVTGKWVRVV